MKKRSISVILLFVMTVSTTIFAQNAVNIHVGAALPIGEFGSNDVNSSSASGAATGFNVGIELRQKITNNGLNAFAGIDYIYNGLTEKMKSDFSTELGSPYKLDIDYLHYSNIPMMAGLNFQNRIGNNTSLFFNLGAGVDFLSISDMSISMNGQTLLMTTTSKSAFAFKAGGGLLLGNRFLIEAHYLGLGKHHITQTAKMGSISETLENDIEVATVNLTFGIRF